MSSLTEIKTEEEYHAHVASLPATTLLVISFSAQWAAPCKQMHTVLTTLASTYPATNPPSTSWITMDAEEIIEISDAFNVTAVPFLVLTRNGQVLETVSGSDAQKVRDAIERQAKAAPIASSSSSNGAARPQAAAPAKDLSQYTPAASDPKTAPEYTAPAAEPKKETKEELHARLANLVKAAPVMLFMKGTPSAPQCGFSRQTVALLREKSVKYGFFNILADDDVRQGLKEFADWPTFPQLWVDGELVGGLDIVKEELANDPDFLKPYSVTKTTEASA